MWQSPEKELEAEPSSLPKVQPLNQQDYRGTFGNPDSHRDPKFLAMTHEMGFLFQLKQRKFLAITDRIRVFVPVEEKTLFNTF
jgi:hypothetical protein